MKHKWVRTIAFFILLYLLCSYFARVATAAGTDSVGNYSAGLTVAGLYAEPENSLDVLIFGSSTLRSAFLPKVIWDEQGITSYNLSSPSQDATISYFLLRNTLKTQTPRVVVLNASQLFTVRETENLSADVVSIAAAMRPGEVKCSMLFDTGWHVKWQSAVALFFPILIVHTNMPYVKANDYLLANYRMPGNLKGAMPYLTRVELPANPSSPADSGEVVSFDDGGLVYWQKILDLCEERDIAVLIAIPPKTHNWTEPYHEMTEVYCVERGLHFLDMNESDVMIDSGFDVTRDYYDNGQHVNLDGAVHLSAYLAEYLRDNYQLPNHKGDNTYAGWNDCYLPDMED